MTTARLYGLGIDADFDLHDAGVPATSIDVRVRTLPPFTDWTPLSDGEVALDFATDEPWYTLIERSDGSWQFRVHTMCDFSISSDLSDVQIAMHTSSAVGMDAIMTTGTLLSLLLFLRSTPVLHGSAVEVDGESIGFIGHSGQGKTTMATLLCAEGATIVTDDVLVLDDVDAAPRVRRGSRELRMRSGLTQLADHIPGAGRRISADSRDVVVPAHTALDSAPLRALVIPRPRRDGGEFALTRLRPKQATLALMSFPRLMGWRSPRVLGEILRVNAATAGRVPVLIADVPWGPPFPDGLTEAILAATEGELE